MRFFAVSAEELRYGDEFIALLLQVADSPDGPVYAGAVEIVEQDDNPVPGTFQNGGADCGGVFGFPIPGIR